MKVVLFCFVILFISFSSSEVVRVTIRGEASIAKTDDNFVCATLDWWPAEKCDYNQCPWGNSSILNLALFSFFFPIFLLLLCIISYDIGLKFQWELSMFCRI